MNLEWYMLYAENDYKGKRSIFICEQKQKLNISIEI